MRANSPSAIFASLLLHATVAGIIAGLSFYIAQVQQQQRPPVIFDLVAGPPTAPEQLVAPALGNTLTAPKVAPKINEPMRQPEVAPEPEPEQTVETVKAAPVEESVPTPPKETPKPKQKVKEVPKPKQPLSKDAKAVANQLDRKRMVSYLNEKKKIDREIAKQEAARRAAEARAAKAAAGVKGVDVEGIREGVIGGSPTNKKGGGSGKALSREEADALRVYQALLKNELQGIFDELKPTGLADSLNADVSFLVAASGEVGNVRITRSSGNAEFDQAVLATFRKLVWSKRRPDGRSNTWELTFRMRDLD
ncbi:MAG: TonB family protein [Opitutae bacterium]|nr:TonB family protein [Opitutae bacterium]